MTNLFSIFVFFFKSLFRFLPRIMNAGIAGIVGVTCVFPLDLAKTRWQNTPVPVAGTPPKYTS